MKLLTAKNRGDRTMTIHTSLLSPMVEVIDQDFNSLVEESLLEDGLQHPIVVLALTVNDWYEEKRTTNPDILNPPDLNGCTTVYRVQCGNNRLAIAKKLGYTDIDCILVYTLDDAQNLCKLQRKDKEWKGA